jgi:hypothetical protein
VTETVSRCAKCDSALAERPDVPAEKRKLCPTCGSTARVVSGSATLGVNVTVVAPPAMARASAPAPKIVISNLEDAGFSLQWLQLSPGGAWMVRVFDRQGEWLDGAVADDP